MTFVGWSYDIARDQSPSVEFLCELIDRSADAGYNALGLYLEHRFAYASTPWAQASGCVTPEMARLAARHGRERGVRVIPFLNTLGHMEGFLHAAGGEWLAEGPADFGAQMCPSNPQAVEFARGLVADALQALDDEWVHLGGDETRQLGQCLRCAARVEKIGKAGLYGEYFGALCRWTLERGKRPCLWADMLLQHPEALAAIPRETILFDWQYEKRPRETTARLREAGFDVVCCPSVQSYNSAWVYLDATYHNIDEHRQDAAALGALGTLVTTWEFTYFSAFESIAPLVFAAGKRHRGRSDWRAALTDVAGREFAEAAEILGNHVPAAAAFIAPGSWRRLRENLVMRCNPFSLWRHWREEACGAAGEMILGLLDRAEKAAPNNAAFELPIELHRAGVYWTRQAQRAADHYANRDASRCVDELRAGQMTLLRLRAPLDRVASRGGSRADIARLTALVEHIERVIDRIRRLASDASYWPAFEVIAHERYVERDQAAWRAATL